MFDHPCLWLALVSLVITSVATVVGRNSDYGRWAGVVGILIHLAVLLFEPQSAVSGSFPLTNVLLGRDAVNTIPLVVTSFFGAGLLALMPRQQIRSGFAFQTVLWVLANDISLMGSSPWVLCVGWILGWLPFVKDLDSATWIGFALASVLLGVGIAGGETGMPFLLAAVVLRKGMFPAHGWVVRTFAKGALLPGILLVNSHAGAFALIRLAPHAPAWFTDIALATAIYAAAVGLRDRAPRRTLAWIAISQASFLVAGIESGTTEGFTGALLLWQIVAGSTATLVAILVALETRVNLSFNQFRHLGLATSTPRLGVAFIIAGLALVGAPATIGFCAEDLLLHGTLSAHPRIGLLLPIATAMNAITIVRLFSQIFLGPAAPGTGDVPDALPRERAALTAVMLFLIGMGLAPKWLTQRCETAASAVLGISAKPQSH